MTQFKSNLVDNIEEILQHHGRPIVTFGNGLRIRSYIWSKQQCTVEIHGFTVFDLFHRIYKPGEWVKDISELAHKARTEKRKELEKIKRKEEYVLENYEPIFKGNGDDVV